MIFLDVDLMLNHRFQDFSSFHVFKMILLPLHRNLLNFLKKTPVLCELKLQQIFSDSKIPFIYFKYKQQQIPKSLKRDSKHSNCDSFTVEKNRRHSFIAPFKHIRECKMESETTVYGI